jgi:hypothetical protein
MTVRAWFTISALVLLALSAAVIVRLLAPVAAPEILARVGDTRLDGTRIASCWPQRGNDLRCEEGGDDDRELRTIPSSGRMRLIVTYPAQPEKGWVRIDGENDDVAKRDWDDEFRYNLEPGEYQMVAHADYPQNARVRYRFAFRVTRSGS